MVSCVSINRIDQTALKNRQKSLYLFGFSQFEQDLYIRPNNLQISKEVLKKNLIDLGLSPKAYVFLASSFEKSSEDIVNQLWNVQSINANYIKTYEILKHWMIHQDDFDLEKKIIESYLLSNRSIRQILYDPYLPDQFINIEAQQNLIEIATRFELNYKQVWNYLLSEIV
jgi:phenylacetic acid degradation operon negative regulatory protein